MEQVNMVADISYKVVNLKWRRNTLVWEATGGSFCCFSGSVKTFETLKFIRCAYVSLH